MTSILRLLDTDTASHPQRGRPNVVERAADPSLGPIGLTIITQIEMREGRYHGLRTANNKTELLRAWQHLQDLEAFFLQLRIVPLDEAAATIFDRLVKMKLGKIGRSDLLIASIVLSHHAILVTHNVKDFQRVPNLTIEDWMAR